jgi:hypothetical protein
MALHRHLRLKLLIFWEVLFWYHNDMANNEAAVEQFRKNMSRVYKQNPINERDFLYLSKEATDLVKIQWEDREIIASRIMTIWMKHEEELSDDSNRIGSMFWDLELPDGHVERTFNNEKTVKELWAELDYVIMYAIHKMETDN